MVRIAEAEFDAVMRRSHVRPMDFTGKPLRGFVYIARHGFRTRAALKEWVERGEKAVKAKAATRRA